MTTEHLQISVADDYMDRFPEVVEDLKKAGLDVEQQLETLGVVSGSIDVEQRAKLDAVQGIAAVELSREYRLPPPDSDIQ